MAKWHGTMAHTRGRYCLWWVGGLHSIPSFIYRMPVCFVYHSTVLGTYVSMGRSVYNPVYSSYQARIGNILLSTRSGEFTVSSHH